MSKTLLIDRNNSNYELRREELTKFAERHNFVDFEYVHVKCAAGNTIRKVLPFITEDVTTVVFTQRNVMGNDWSGFYVEQFLKNRGVKILFSGLSFEEKAAESLINCLYNHAGVSI